MTTRTHTLLAADGEPTTIARVLVALPLSGWIDARQLDIRLGGNAVVIDADNPCNGYAVQNAMRVLRAAQLYAQRDGFADDGSAAREFMLTNRGLCVRACVVSGLELGRGKVTPAAAWGAMRMIVTRDGVVVESSVKAGEV